MRGARRRQHRPPAARRGPRRRRRRRRRGVVVPARVHDRARSGPAAAALLNLADDHLDWHRTFDAYARAEGPHLRAPGPPTTCSCTTPTTPWSPRSPPTRPAGGSPFSVAPGAASGLPGRRRRDRPPARRPPTAPSSSRSTTLAHRAPHDLANALAAAALALEVGREPPPACADALGRLHRARPPPAAGGGARRRALLRRLEGDQRARDDRRGPRLPVGRADRRRPQQGPRPRRRSRTSSGTCAAVVAIGDAADEVAAALHERGPGHDRAVDARRRARRARRSPSPATSCSCRPRARPSTGTTGTPRGATTSPARSPRLIGACAGERPDRRRPRSGPGARRAATRGRAPARPRSRPRAAGPGDGRGRAPRRAPRSGTYLLAARHDRGAQRHRRRDGALGVVGRLAHELRLGVVLLRAPARLDACSASSRSSLVVRDRLPPLAARRPPAAHRDRRCCSSLVLVPGFGVYVGGSRRWLGIGSWRFQPSEVAKLALLLFAADLLTRREDELGDWRRVLAPGLLVVVGRRGARAASSPTSTRRVLLALIVAAVLVAGGIRLRHLGSLGGTGSGARGDRSRSRRRTGGPACSRSCTRRPTRRTPATRSCSR